MVFLVDEGKCQGEKLRGKKSEGNGWEEKKSGGEKVSITKEKI